MNIRVEILPEKKLPKTAPDLNQEFGLNLQHLDMFWKRHSPEVGGHEMAISGHRIGPAARVRPAKAFWSQHASTCLPVTTDVYSHRLDLQRSMTEVKLLGESMYPESRRDTQSAEVIHTTEAVQECEVPQRQVKTTDASHRPGDILGEGKRAPPPTREGLGRGAPTSSHVVTPRNHPGSMEKLSGTRKLNPKDLHLNLKKIENSDLSKLNKNRREKLKMVLSRSTSSPDGRLIRENVKLLSFKTREEATRHYRKLIEDKEVATKPCVPQVHIVSELERSYTFVSTVREEMTRPQTDVKSATPRVGGQYTKSEYGLNMQNTISRKYLNKHTLPAAFRKNHNTFLKHYGTPIFDDRTRHYNTPAASYRSAETLVTCTPVSLFH